MQPCPLRQSLFLPVSDWSKGRPQSSSLQAEAQGRLNMTLMARVSAERAAQSNAAATSSGVKPKRCVMSGITSTFLLAIRFRHSGYCRKKVLSFNR